MGFQKMEKMDFDGIVGKVLSELLQMKILQKAVKFLQREHTILEITIMLSNCTLHMGVSAFIYSFIFKYLNLEVVELGNLSEKIWIMWNKIPH